MPIGPTIYSQLKPVAINTPFENLRHLMSLQEAQQQSQARGLAIRKAEQDEQEQLAFRRIMEDTGGDWEYAEPLLKRHAPSIYPVYAKRLAEEREARFKAMREESAAELADAEVGLRSFQMVLDHAPLPGARARAAATWGPGVGAQCASGAAVGLDCQGTQPGQDKQRQSDLAGQPNSTLRWITVRTRSGLRG
jgi:hypothetical protein